MLNIYDMDFAPLVIWFHNFEKGCAVLKEICVYIGNTTSNTNACLTDAVLSLKPWKNTQKMLITLNVTQQNEYFLQYEIYE